MGNKAHRRIERLEKLITGNEPGSKQWKRAGQKAARWDRQRKKSEENVLPKNENDPRYDFHVAPPQHIYSNAVTKHSPVFKQIEKATPFNQDELDLTKKQIDNMSQEDWDKLPIVTGAKAGTLAAEKARTLEAEKPQPNKALKITKGILRLLSPTPAYDAARIVYSKLNKWKIDKRDAAREYNPPKIN